MADGLADVVEQAAHLGRAHVAMQLRGHESRQMAGFDGVVVLVLAVAGAEFEPADQFQ